VLVVGPGYGCFVDVRGEDRLVALSHALLESGLLASMRV